MRVPISWLREFAELPASVDEIADRLAMLGFPVAEIAAPANRGRRYRKNRHARKASQRRPVAGRAGRCRRDAPLTIATAATNVAAGQHIAVATIGAQLPNLKIERRTMRGVESQGMMISAEELALPAEWFEDGIMQFDAGTPPGLDVVERFGLDTAVLDVEITSNRPDAMSVAGLARELAASYGVPLRLPPPLNPGREDRAPGRGAGHAGVAGLPPFRRAAIRRRARRAGTRVDADPLGARGPASDQQPGGRVELRDARDRPAFAFLRRGEHSRRNADRSQRACKREDRDARRRRARADAASARHRRRRAAALPRGAHGKRNGRSRHENRRHRRGVGQLRRPARPSDERRARVAERGVVAPREIARARIDRRGRGARGAAPGRPRRDRISSARVRRRRRCGAPIELPVREVERLLGLAIPGDRIERHLTALGCAVTADAPGVLSVTPPRWRRDLTIAADLVEEVARIEGYERIEAVVPSVPPHDISSAPFELERRIARALAALGYREIVSYSLPAPPTELPPHVAKRNPGRGSQSALRGTALSARLARPGAARVLCRARGARLRNRRNLSFAGRQNRRSAVRSPSVSRRTPRRSAVARFLVPLAQRRCRGPVRPDTGRRADASAAARPAFIREKRAPDDRRPRRG